MYKIFALIILLSFKEAAASSYKGSKVPNQPGKGGFRVPMEDLATDNFNDIIANNRKSATYKIENQGRQRSQHITLDYTGKGSGKAWRYP